MTLNENESDPNWYQNVEFRSLYHHTKFYKNQYTNAPKSGFGLGLFFFFWGGVGGVRHRCCWTSTTDYTDPNIRHMDK